MNLTNDPDEMFHLLITDEALRTRLRSSSKYQAAKTQGCPGPSMEDEEDLSDTEFWNQQAEGMQVDEV